MTVRARPGASRRLLAPMHPSTPPLHARAAGRPRSAIAGLRGLVAALVIAASLAAAGCGSGQHDRPEPRPPGGRARARTLPPLEPAARVPVRTAGRYFAAAAH